MDIREYADEVDGWVLENGGYFPPLANLARLAEEVGELARAMGAQFGPKTPKPGEMTKAFEEELGDLFFTLAVLAKQLDVDPERAATLSLEKVRHRDQGRFSG